MDHVVELYELVSRILDWISNVMECVRVNKLWNRCVLDHSDYKTFWNKGYKPCCVDIIKYGSFKMIQLYKGSIDVILYGAAEYGNLDFIVYICKNYNVADNVKSSLHLVACGSGQLNVAKYLHEYADRENSICFDDSVICLDNFIDIFKYVYCIYEINNIYEMSLTACKHGNLDFIKYLCKNEILILGDDSVIDAALESGNEGIINYLSGA